MEIRGADASQAKETRLFIRSQLVANWGRGTPCDGTSVRARVHDEPAGTRRHKPCPRLLKLSLGNHAAVLPISRRAR